MSIFDPATWRVLNRAEALENIRGVKQRAMNRGEGEPPEKTLAALAIRSAISPVDIYAYLKARFGEPNGFLTFLAARDSDNLIHWDYELIAGDTRLTFTGFTQEFHVSIKMKPDLSDTEWLHFIKNLKRDFGRVGRQKSETVRSFQKWHIFPNQFLSLANRCAEYHGDLIDSLAQIDDAMDLLASGDPSAISEDNLAKLSGITNSLVSCSVELPILMPVMFESFIGLIVGLMTREDVRANKRLFDDFVRRPLDLKLYDLHIRCEGFARGIAPNNAQMRRYWDIVNKRNDVIHGNVDPITDAIEVVYFDGFRPLYTVGGHRIAEYWRGLIRFYDPAMIVADYEATHDFIAEILDHMEPPHRRTMLLVMKDTQPGWDGRRRMPGILFSDVLIHGQMGPIRSDTELREATE